MQYDTPGRAVVLNISMPVISYDTLTSCLRLNLSHADVQVQQHSLPYKIVNSNNICSISTPALQPPPSCRSKPVSANSGPIRVYCNCLSVLVFNNTLSYLTGGNLCTVISVSRVLLMTKTYKLKFFILAAFRLFVHIFRLGQELNAKIFCAFWALRDF